MSSHSEDYSEIKMTSKENEDGVSEMFRAEGQLCGLTGIELANYVRESRIAWTRQQNSENIERKRADAEIMKAEAERKEKAAIEMKQVEAEINMKSLEAQKRMEVELEKVRLQSELELKKCEVRKQVELDKAEKEAAEATSKLELEREKLRLEHDRAQVEKQRELENITTLKQMELEACSRNLDRQHSSSLELATLRADRGLLGPTGSFGEIEHHRGPKMECGILSSTDRVTIEAFIASFRRLAKLQKLEGRHYAGVFASKLRGELLQVFNRMPEDKIEDFEEIVKAISKKFLLTPEYFRTQFRSAKVETGESTNEFFDRLRESLNRWLELEQVGETYEELCDFLIRDQFYFRLNNDRDKLHFIKSKEASGLKEVARYADLYETIHMDVKKRDSEKSTHKNIANTVKAQIQSGPNNFRPGNAAVGCTHCGRTNHSREHCYELQGKPAVGMKPSVPFMQGGRPRIPGALPQNGYRQQGSFGGDNRHAPHQQGAGYRGQQNIRPAPNTTQRGPVSVNAVQQVNEVDNNNYGAPELYNSLNRPAGTSKENSSSVTVGPSRIPYSHCDTHISGEGEISLHSSSSFASCGCMIHEPDYETQALVRETGLNPYSVGYVGKVKVTCLRDTGSQINICAANLVEPHQYVDKYMNVRLADGSVSRYRVAKINVRTPFFTGETLATVFERPIVDLILGNLPYVSLDFDRPGVVRNFEEKSSELHESERPQLPDTRGTLWGENKVGHEDSIRSDEEAREQTDLKLVSEDKNKLDLISSQSEAGIVSNEVQVIDEADVGAVTRAAARKMQIVSKGVEDVSKVKPLIFKDFKALELSVDAVKQMQENDKSLDKIRKVIDKPGGDCMEKYVHMYKIKNGLIYRKFRSARGLIEMQVTQLVVPKELRLQVMIIGHSSVLGAHMGYQKTFDQKLKRHFIGQEFMTT